jgi:hypothetical protein
VNGFSGGGSSNQAAVDVFSIRGLCHCYLSRDRSLEPEPKLGIAVSGGRAMPVYHFELANGHRLADPSGLECESDQDARVKARIMARQIAADLDDNTDRSLVVVDESGAEIYKLPLK